MPTTWARTWANEVRGLAVAVRAPWRAGRRPYVTATAVLAIAAFWLLRRFGVWSNPIDSLSAVRANEPLIAALVRVPLSLLVPAVGLPVWGALVQVAIVGALAELVLGRRRMIGLAFATQYVATVAGRVAAQLGGGRPYGLRPAAAFVRDTGPSAAVVALGLAVAVVVGAWWLAGLASVGLFVEIVGLHTLAGREHLAAIAVGLGVGWWWRAGYRRGVARLAAAAFGVIGAVLLYGLVDPTPSGRLQHIVLALGPVVSAHPSRLAALMAGSWFWFVASSLRRGQRSALLLAIATVAPAVVVPANVRGTHGAAAVAVLLLVLLVTGRHSFPAPTERPALRRAIGGAVSAIGGLLLADLLAPARVDRAMESVSTIAFVAVLAVACWWVTRPAHPTFTPQLAAVRARRVVERYGSGTLDYFALRDDKSWFFFGDSVVAYAVKGSVALVSPDPIGPGYERHLVWAAFLDHAAENGWMVTVLGASAPWVALYRAHGMRAVYVGDEAVVDTSTFHLDGGDRKGLRQAVNRVARNGYTVSFQRPDRLDVAMRADLERLVGSSRRGSAERGFSMTLGRLFDPADTGVLLAVSHAPDGRAVAFCQFVPQAGGAGWSLDVMRSERHGHPNGLLDHVLVETFQHIRSSGGGEVCLNFATLRTLLDRSEPTRSARIARAALRRASSSMQIESLWRFNAKFFPEWRPRYVVYPTMVDLPSAALAIAQAEAIWELPIIGRFLQPSGRAARGPAPA